MIKQSSHTLLMIEPVAFGFNRQTAANNYFQRDDGSAPDEVQRRASSEFGAMVSRLEEKGVEVISVRDTPEPHTPDSIFPNNWVSFHEDGTVCLYPMYAENRRAERRLDILDNLETRGFRIDRLLDYTPFEKEGKYLEGTGSMTLDRVNKTAYAALSERTDEDLFLLFCRDAGYRPVRFHANQTVGNQRLPIYHTNVMMCIGGRYAVLCTDSIDDPDERRLVLRSLEQSNREIVEISERQMYRFAGNMLQVGNRSGDLFLVMSRSAYDSLTVRQIEVLSGYNEIIVAEIPTIEKYGGGSARCMLAELFLPRKGQ